MYSDSIIPGQVDCSTRINKLTQVMWFHNRVL